jgi:hypothetical protein
VGSLLPSASCLLNSSTFRIRKKVEEFVKIAVRQARKIWLVIG